VPLETTDESWLKTECKKRGVLCVKLTLMIGIPDRMLLAAGARVVFTELKTPVGKLSKMQLWWQRRLRDLGFDVFCVDSREDLTEILKKLNERAQP